MVNTTPIREAQQLLEQAAVLVEQASDFGDARGSQRTQIVIDLRSTVARLGRLHDRRTG